MAYAQDFFLELIVAMLAVNRWTIERTATLMDSLKTAGLSDPATVRSMTLDEVSKRLADAGYARGDYMQRLLGERILSAAFKLDDDAMARVEQLERLGDSAGLRRLLMDIQGVGPEVIRNVLLLRSSGAGE
jgi:endonuclease III-like uncharacterized protein